MTTNTDSIIIPRFWAPTMRKEQPLRTIPSAELHEQERQREDRERAWERQARMLTFFNLR